MNLNNRSSLLKINTTTSLLYQIVVFICGFVLPKLIIDNYGSAVNGLIASITQFLGIIALCELGMGAVVPASLYKPLADKNIDAISKVVLSSEKFYRRIAILMLLYVLVLAVVYPYIVDGFPFIYTASLLVIIASSTFAQYFFGISYSLLIIADQRQYITYFVNGGTLIVNLVLSYILIRVGASIHMVKLLSAAIFILRPICYTIYVKRHYPLNKNVVYKEEPIKQKWNGVAQHLAYTVQEKAGFIILSVACSLEAVSVYSVYFLITEGLRAFVYSITSGLSSYIGNILAKSETELLKSGFMKIEWALHSIAIIVYSCAAVLIMPFVSIYTQGVTDANYMIPVFPVLICAVICIRCLQLPYTLVVQAAGHFKETQNSAILEPIVNIIVSLLLVKEYNLTGVAIGMLFSVIYRMMYLSIYLTKHILNNSGRLLFKRLIVDVVLAITIFLLCSHYQLQSVSYMSWAILAVEVAATSIFIALGINLLFYTTETLSLFRSVICRNNK